jgi:hypothetical protein
MLGKMLTKYLMNRTRNQWDLYLNEALFASRVQTHSTTLFSLFFFLYRREPKLPPDEASLPPMTDSFQADRQLLFKMIRTKAYFNTVWWAKINKHAWNGSVVPSEYKTSGHVFVHAEGQRKYERTGLALIPVGDLTVSRLVPWWCRSEAKEGSGIGM